MSAPHPVALLEPTCIFPIESRLLQVVSVYNSMGKSSLRCVLRFIASDIALTLSSYIIPFGYLGRLACNISGLWPGHIVFRGIIAFQS